MLADQICYEVIIISKYQWHNVMTRNVRIGATWPEILSRFLLAWAVIRAGLLTSNYEYLLQRFIETLSQHEYMVTAFCIGLKYRPKTQITSEKLKAVSSIQLSKEL